MAERNYELCWYCQVDNGENTTNAKLYKPFKNDEEGLKKSYENVVSQFKSLLKYDQLPEGSFIDSFAKDISDEDYGALLCEKKCVYPTLDHFSSTQNHPTDGQRESAVHKATKKGNGFDKSQALATPDYPLTVLT